MYICCMKKCTNCHTIKSIDCFNTYNCTVKGKQYQYIRNFCQECIRLKSKTNSKLKYKSVAAKPNLLENEFWENIQGFENYFVSDLGRVKRNDKQILKEETTNQKYKRVVFSKNGVVYKKSVHRLVALYFVPNPENKPFVNHINGIKSDNRAINLEWCTQSENQIHAFKTGLQKSKKYGTI